MKLYHGTSSKFLKSILDHGILPRGDRFPDQWPGKGTRKDLVYLTSCFGPLYALNATHDSADQWLILEVNIPYKKLARMMPDEAYHAARAGQDGKSPDAIRKGEAEYRKHLERHRNEWKESLKYVGNVAHKPSIPANAITRYCLFDASLRQQLVATFVIAIQKQRLPHDVLLPYFKMLTAWFFGDHERLPKPPQANLDTISNVIDRESSDNNGHYVERR